MSRQVGKSHLRNKHKGRSRYTYVRRSRISTPIKRTEIHLKTFDKEIAKRQIYEFISKNPRIRTSEVIERLRINPVQAAEILGELESDGFVLSRDIERQRKEGLLHSGNGLRKKDKAQPQIVYVRYSPNEYGQAGHGRPYH